MRKLHTIQVICALLAWFYGSKVELVNYPGAFSASVDGPFRVKADCERARQEYQDLANQFGVKVELTKCFEKLPA